MLLLASLLLATFLMLLAPCMKSLFWLVTMLFLAHHVAAGIPAVADVPNAVGTLHEVPVFDCAHAVFWRTLLLLASLLLLKLLLLC